MKLLLFEWLVGGGMWFDGIAPDPRCSFQSQGRKMMQWLGHDLRTTGAETIVPIDSRLERRDFDFGQSLFVGSADELLPSLLHCADVCDAIMLIVPECNGCLIRCCQWLNLFAPKLLSPDLEFVSLTSDKQKTSQWLQQNSVQVPIGCRLDQFDSKLPPTDFTFPAVVKPIHGAGSDGILYIESWPDIQLPPLPENYRIESFRHGTSVSVSILCHGDRFEVLPPTGQVFDRWPIGNYIDTRFPLPLDQADRARLLAEKAVSALPPTQGYIGIDMILNANNPDLDCVVDVNPRLTMSYGKLRKICGFNIAERMLVRR